MNVLESIERHEGYGAKPYLDTKRVWTVGIGFTYLTLEESRAVLTIRVRDIKRALNSRISHLSQQRQDVLIEMAYQLGIDGLYDFKKMWKALERNDCDEVIREMLDSQWARIDSPKRAIELATRFYDN